MLGKLTTFILLVVLLGGCATTPEPIEPKIPSFAFSHLAGPERQPVLTDKQIFALTDEQREQWLSYFSSPEQRDTSPHIRLVDYLNTRLSAFNYMGETLVSSEVLGDNRGNCMSLAVLTTSLADAVALETKYNLIYTSPIFWQKNNTLLLSSHVNTEVYASVDPNDMPYFSPSRVVIDYFPSRGDKKGKKVTRSSMVALFYLNMAADALLSDNFESAYSYALAAYEKDHTNPNSLSMIGVILRRAGYTDSAEKVYRFAIENELANADLLENYAIYLRYNGRKTEADEVEQQISQSTDDNPYSWIKRGHSAYDRGDWSKANQYYRRALREAPYMAEAYFGIALLRYEEGELEEAANAMFKASERAFDKERREQYRKKLQMLKTMLEETN